MTTPDVQRCTVLALALLALTGSLAGCSTTPPPPIVPTGPYVDGEYSAAGEYTSPAGREIIEVTVTLEKDLIAEVHVRWTDGDASDEVAHFQNAFDGDIQSVVIGVDIDEIQVDRVGGSSLTSGGFNDAIELIKLQAMRA